MVPRQIAHEGMDIGPTEDFPTAAVKGRQCGNNTFNALRKQRWTIG